MVTNQGLSRCSSEISTYDSDRLFTLPLLSFSLYRLELHSVIVQRIKNDSYSSAPKVECIVFEKSQLALCFSFCFPLRSCAPDSSFRAVLESNLASICLRLIHSIHKFQLSHLAATSMYDWHDVSWSPNRCGYGNQVLQPVNKLFPGPPR